MAVSTKIIGAAVFVALNNMAWYYASLETPIKDTQLKETQLSETHLKEMRPEVTQLSVAELHQTIIKSPHQPSAPVQKNTPRANTANTHVPALAPKPMELDANLPARESEELITDQAFSKETFNIDSQEQKLATIERLSPQGEDLIFLQNIIESQDSDEIKIAALARLNGQQHFGALSTAIGVLNKENANMSLAALDVIKNSRDASLIPQLRSRALTIKNEMLQQEINATINHLENSLTMGMDFANR